MEAGTVNQYIFSTFFFFAPKTWETLNELLEYKCFLLNMAVP